MAWFLRPYGTGLHPCGVPGFRCTPPGLSSCVPYGNCGVCSRVLIACTNVLIAWTNVLIACAKLCCTRRRIVLRHSAGLPRSVGSPGAAGFGKDGSSQGQSDW